jgi:predicted transcriptional regulator
MEPSRRRPYSTAIPVHGPAVRRLRLRRDIPTHALAQRIGVSRPYLCKIELGEGDAARRVSRDVFDALIRELRPRTRKELIAEPPALDEAAA